MSFNYYAIEDYKHLVGADFLVLRNAETGKLFAKEDYIEFIESVSTTVRKENDKPYQKNFMKKMMEKV